MLLLASARGCPEIWTGICCCTQHRKCWPGAFCRIELARLGPCHEGLFGRAEQRARATGGAGGPFAEISDLVRDGVGVAGVRTPRAGLRRAALHAAMGDVLEIVRLGAVRVPCRCDG